MTLAITLATTLAIWGTQQHAFRLPTNANVAQEVERRKAELMGGTRYRGSAGGQETETHGFADDEAATTQLS